MQVRLGRQKGRQSLVFCWRHFGRDQILPKEEKPGRVLFRGTWFLRDNENVIPELSIPVPVTDFHTVCVPEKYKSSLEDSLTD